MVINLSTMMLTSKLFHDKNFNSSKTKHPKPTRWPNIIVLVVSPRWRGEGPIVITSEVLAVPVTVLHGQISQLEC